MITKQENFDWHISGEMDWGFDFLCATVMVAPDGRRLIVAWANEWEWMPLFKDWGPTYQEGWCDFFNVIVKFGCARMERWRLFL